MTRGRSRDLGGFVPVTVIQRRPRATVQLQSSQDTRAIALALPELGVIAPVTVTPVTVTHRTPPVTVIPASVRVGVAGTLSFIRGYINLNPQFLFCLDRSIDSVFLGLSKHRCHQNLIQIAQSLDLS